MRHRMSRRASNRNFRRGTRSHKRNSTSAMPMRGGIRL